MKAYTFPRIHYKQQIKPIAVNFWIVVIVLLQAFDFFFVFFFSFFCFILYKEGSLVQVTILHHEKSSLYLYPCKSTSFQKRSNLSQTYWKKKLPHYLGPTIGS
jgi:hypothetical protein